MAVYSVNTTAPQETILDAFLVILNARRAAQSPPLPALTKAQVVQASVDDRTLDLRAQVNADRRAPIVPALDNATQAQVNQIRTILGLP